MGKFIAVTLSIFVLVAFSEAQVQLPGNCPDIQAVDPFDLTQYLGEWYEIERYFTFFQIDAICVRARYSDNFNGSIEVYNAQTNNVTKEIEIEIGFAVPEDPDSSAAKLLVSFPRVGQFDAPYWVIDTDYINYSIVWSCRNFGPNSLQTIWFLSRTPEASNYTKGYVRGFLNGLNLRTDLLIPTEQQNCTYPE